MTSKRDAPRLFCVGRLDTASGNVATSATSSFTTLAEMSPGSDTLLSRHSASDLDMSAMAPPPTESPEAAWVLQQLQTSEATFGVDQSSASAGLCMKIMLSSDVWKAIREVFRHHIPASYPTAAARPGSMIVTLGGQPAEFLLRDSEDESDSASNPALRPTHLMTSYGRTEKLEVVCARVKAPDVNNETLICKLTIDVLLHILRGVHILSSDWLFSSLRAKTWLDPTPFHMIGSRDNLLGLAGGGPSFFKDVSSNCVSSSMIMVVVLHALLLHSCSPLIL
jgi:hypothetical protein